ncbi:MAG: 1,4-dihydroxy-2-naphthoate polyprenyltransferase [Actinobacteria bacterium]|nr:1,4-dihydroxy-2-naphthoate polyprenyltransferase [Actinomycetota bacterium]
MATAHEWLEGARPRTLPAAIAPVAVGAGLGAWAAAFDLPRVLLALLVAVALQVGVNFANDYSDGIKGTDAARVGPVRLVGQGLAAASRVKAAAFGCFAIGAIAGLLLVALTGQWWLLLVGAASIAAAWLYTGGPRPYGYAGLGEIFVFIFFGLVPVIGTAYVQTLTITAPDVVASVGVGLLACAILVTNNLRDIAGDTVAGKITLAVRLGDARTRHLYATIVVLAILIPIGVGLLTSPWVVVASLTGVLAIRPVRIVLGGALGPALIPALKLTGVLLLFYGLALGLALALA